MPDAALKQYAQMHKDDPYTVSLAIAESNRRKEIRAGSAQQQPQPSVADAEISHMDERQASPQMFRLPEQQGIGALPAPNMQGMASGGIVAFDRGGRTGDVGAMQYRKYAMDRAKDMGLDPSFVNAIFTYESGYKPNAKSPTGPVGIGQLTAATGSAYGVSKEDRKDPYKNIDASLAYMADLNKKYNGDQQKMAVAYNQGEPFLDKHLRQNGGNLVPQKLNKKEPQTYLQKVGEIMTAAIPSAQAGELPQTAARAAPAPVAAAPEEADRSIMGQFKRIGEGVGRVGEMIAPKETLYSPSGKPLEDTRGFFERAASGVGIPEEFQRNFSTTLNAIPEVNFLRAPKAVGRLSAAQQAVRAAEVAKAEEAAAAAAAKVANVRLPPTATPSGAKGVAALSEEEKVRRGLAAPTPVPAKPAQGIAALSDAERAKRGLAPRATEFPLSPEAVEMNRRVAAARAAAAGQKAAPVAGEAGAAGKVYPLGADAIKMNEELAAAKNAQALRNLKADEQAAVNATKLAEEAKLAANTGEGLEALSAAKTANAANRVIRPVNTMVDAARLNNAAEQISSNVSFPRASTSEQAPPEEAPYDMNREFANLQNRYPAPEQGYEPAALGPYTGLPSQYSEPESQKEVISLAKEATPKTAATKGFTNEDWLNLGFGLLAGKSQYALENLGTAGLGTLAAKRERENAERTAALTEAIHTPEAERMIRNLMQEKGLDYASAMEAYFKNKNYIDTRMYGYDRAANAKVDAASTSAGARTTAAETAAGARNAATDAEARKSYLTAIEKLNSSPVGLLRKSNPAAYNEALDLIKKAYPTVAGGEGEASSGVKLLNVR